MPRRVFFGLWPDAALRDCAQQLRASHAAAGRDVPRAHLHLTLAFAGSVDESRLADLRRAAGHVVAPPFALTLDRLDGFAAASVQWLGPSDPPAALPALAKTLNSACRRSGIATEDTPFRPHMTLRRGVQHPVACAVEPLHWTVRDFVLIESGRSGRPGTYRLLGRWRLLSAAAWAGR